MALQISLNPVKGRIGDTVVISAVPCTTATTSCTFTYPEYNKNVVTFKGTTVDIIAKIISGTPTELKVIVPPEAITGEVIVETQEDQIDSSEFRVIYEDEKFDQSVDIFGKAIINEKVRTKGLINEYTSPIYNKDLSYSNFVEVVDENSLLQNVYTIILTQRGERLFSEFGTDINQILFSPYNDEEELKAKIMDEIVVGIETYEPRVTINQSASYVFIDIHNINVFLTLLMPSGNARELGITLRSMNNLEPIN